jgi:threonyl-tRNA synthetase
VAVRTKKKGNIGTVPVEEFAERALNLIKEKSLEL